MTTAVSERWCGSGGHVSGLARRGMRAAPSPAPIVSPTTARAAWPRGSRVARDAEVI